MWRNKKHGYKSEETALNGLIQWLDRNGFHVEHNYNEYMLKCYNLIIRYADENEVEYSKNRSVENKANEIAKDIKNNNRFAHFTNWAKNQKYVNL